MGLKRVVDVSFWTDGKVDDFTPEDKYFMLYLLTNPFTSLLGIYEMSVKQAAFQMGYSVDAVKALIERFENKYNMIIYSKETNEIAIKNFLRHSVIKGGKPIEDCVKKDMAKVKNKNLILEVFNQISEKDDLNETVKKIVSDYINDNGYGNGYGYGVSYHDTYHDTSKPQKHKYGENNNVLLTDAELDKLKDRFSDWQERIESLSLYLASKGTRYKSHYATILNWARKEEKEKKERSDVNGKASRGTTEDRPQMGTFV